MYKSIYFSTSLRLIYFFELLLSFLLLIPVLQKLSLIENSFIFDVVLVKYWRALISPIVDAPLNNADSVCCLFWACVF